MKYTVKKEICEGIESHVCTIEFQNVIYFMFILFPSKVNLRKFFCSN